ncbi:type VI secretion system tube protein IglC [Vibrio marisflavi]|uniref:Uncharacterized protein n=1 Tax=Vibrio marisflavi CECT 7928 TaxID=634439 RepID=A0ABN8E2Y5_9VIBR|nr:type VI secretion system tube protein IglC [Vibrio marisflavi]CAH0538605.1 hypothetical protein VMF7928_01536 [Vibrio marisflavi CECT 7928]
MANIKPLVPRSVVVDCEPLSFTTGHKTAFGQHNEPRLFCDSCTIFGVEIPKALFCIDGGQEISDVTDATAACTLTEFKLAGPQMAAGLSFTIQCPISPALRTELETAISAVRKGDSSDNTIKFGTWNENQEFKNDDVWGPAMQPPASMVLTPISNSDFGLILGDGHFMGGSTVSCELAPVMGDGFQIDRKSFDAAALDVVHALSTEKGQYALLSIDESAGS